jgi:hypothetical protein
VQIAAAVLADVYPIGYERQPIPEGRGRTGPAVSGKKEETVAFASAEWQLAGNRIFDTARPISLGSTYERYSSRYSTDSDNYYWLTKGLGQVWVAHLQGPEEESKPPRPYLVSPQWLTYGESSLVDLPAGRVTRIRVTIPDDLESRIGQLVDSTTDPAEFAKATLADEGFVRNSRTREGQPPLPRGTPDTSPFFRAAEISVVGSEPIPASLPAGSSPPAASK